MTEEPFKERLEKEKMHQFAAIIESSCDAIFFCMDGIIQSWNSGAEKIFGYTAGEIIGKHISIFVPDAFLEEFFLIIEKVKRGESFRDFEMVQLKKNGIPMNVSLTISSIKGGQEQLIDASLIVRDITKWIQMERLIQENEQKYKQIVENSANAIYTCDFQGFFTYVNPAFIKQTGYDAEEMIGTHFTTLIPPEWKEKVILFYKEQFSKRITETVFSFPYINREKKETWVEQTVILQQEDTLVTGFQSTVRDITKQKKAEDALIKNEERLLKFMDAVKTGVYVLNKEGKLFYENKRSKELLAKGTVPVDIPEDLPQIYMAYIAGTNDLIPRDEQPLALALRKGEIHYREDMELHRSDKCIWIKAWGVPVFDDQGDIEFAVSTFDDITERKKSEEVLKESEERQRQFIEAIPLGIGVIGKNEQIYFRNTKVKEVIDINPMDPLDNISEKHGIYKAGTNELYPSDELPIVRALRTGERIVIDDMEIRQDKIKQIQVWAAPIYDSKENIAYAIAAFEDVTERKNQEKEIRILQNNLTSLLENIQEGIWSLDAHLNLITFNHTFRDNYFSAFGVNVKTGMNLNEFIPPDKFQDQNRDWTNLYTRALTGMHFSEEQSYMVDGRMHNYIMSLYPIVLDGMVTGITVYSKDITDRIISEEKIKNSEQFLNTVIENLPLMLFVKDAEDLKFVRFNKAGEDLLGYSKEDMIGKSDYDFFPKSQADFFIDTDRMVLNTRNISHIAEESINTRLMGTRKLQTTKTVIADKDGKAKYLLGISIDITERKSLEKKQEELFLSLEKKNKELNDFAHIVSHDLKAPLRAIASISYWIQTDYFDKLDENGKNNLTLLVSMVHRLDSLIDGILHYSRVGRFNENKEEINLEALIYELFDVLEHSPTIDFKIENPLPRIYIDRTLVEQVYQNLISNAIKYINKKNGIIRIGCVDEGPDYKFYVSDNGEGIEEKYKDKIFQLFQTLGHKEDKESTGVGLAIVKKIVESKNGKIWVESIRGKGSTFFFTFPKKEVSNIN